MSENQGDWREKLGRIIELHVTPRASRARILPEYGEDGALSRLRVYVTVPPEDGKANAAVIALLAKTLDMPKSALKIVHGHAGRNKRVEISV